MRRILFLPLVFTAALVPLAGAQDSASRPDADLRAHLFQRDRDLIQMLVEGGLRLAAADDALERAECCSGVAERLATALQQAAVNQEKGRVAELGVHLRALLETGVAANLSTARRQIPIGSTLEKNLRAVRDRTTHLLEPLEVQLLRVTDPEDTIQHTLRALQVGRTEVEKAFDDPSR